MKYQEGGMSKYIETGKPKLNIEKSAARRQGDIDSGKEVIVGVNKYKVKSEENVETLEIDNHKVRTAQLKRIKDIKKKRDDKVVKECLDKIEKAAANNQGNLLELSIKASRARCTAGEISTAMEKVWGRYSATHHTA